MTVQEQRQLTRAIRYFNSAEEDGGDWSHGMDILLRLAGKSTDYACGPDSLVGRRVRIKHSSLQRPGHIATVTRCTAPQREGTYIVTFDDAAWCEYTGAEFEPIDRENLSPPFSEDEIDVRRAEAEYENGIGELFDAC